MVLAPVALVHLVAFGNSHWVVVGPSGGACHQDVTKALPVIISALLLLTPVVYRRLSPVRLGPLCSLTR